MSYTKIVMPKFNVNESKATVVEIKVQNKCEIHENDIIFVAEDTKAINEITSQASGYILLMCKEYDEKNVGDTLGIVFESMDELEEYYENSMKDISASHSIEINATKKAIKLAVQLGIDIEEVAKAHPGEVIKEKTIQEFIDSEKQISSDPFNHVFKYDRERVVIIGAGKGAEVLADIMFDDYDKIIVGLVDDFVKHFDTYDFPVLDCGVMDFPDKIDKDSYDTVITSMSANLKMMQFRDRIFKEYSQKGIEFTNAISKSAEIRRGVKLGKGNIIGAGCYIGTLTEIGNNNQISYSVNIGHHNLVGNCNLFAPGCFTSGSVVIGSNCIIPAGVSMINMVSIGDNVILPVGYAVVNSLPSGSVIKQKTTT